MEGHYSPRPERDCWSSPRCTGSTGLTQTPPRAGCTTVVVTASVEKSDLMAEVADRYNASDRQVNGSCYGIAITAAPSGVIGSRLAAADWDPGWAPHPMPGRRPPPPGCNCCVTTALREPAQQELFTDYGFRTYDGRPGTVISDCDYLADDVGVVLKPPSPPVLAAVRAAWTELRKPARVPLVLDVSGSRSGCGHFPPTVWCTGSRCPSHRWVRSGIR